MKTIPVWRKFAGLIVLGCFYLVIFTACNDKTIQTEIDNKLNISEKAKKIEAGILHDNLVNETDLANLTSVELRILRNAVFARHGRPYQKNGLGEYFLLVVGISRIRLTVMICLPSMISKM